MDYRDVAHRARQVVERVGQDDVRRVSYVEDRGPAEIAEKNHLRHQDIGPIRGGPGAVGIQERRREAGDECGVRGIADVHDVDGLIVDRAAVAHVAARMEVMDPIGAYRSPLRPD